MDIKDFIEEVIDMLSDNCSAECFTDDETAWYSEDDIINYLRSFMEEGE